ncbi:MAG: DUF1579 family protein [Acidobacteriota bacterium]
MSIPEKLVGLIGNWSGINHLHIPWMTENPIQESQSEAFIAFSAQEKFLKIEYHWTFDNTKQDGLILLSKEKNGNLIKAFWIDSWHMGDKFMICEGVETDNTISLKGFYAVPDHPDWGWRTTIESENDNSFKITMYNISPEGKEDLAVEINYQRK